ncbi:MAG: hypothetical protein ACYC0V_17970 [Armatimonadota bacterium]
MNEQTFSNKPHPRFRDFFLRLVYVLCTGAIFVVFSELMFWGRYDFAHKVVSDLVPTIIVYSLMAYAFLIVVNLFKVSSLYALFMAGAVFGWLVEGVFVQTMYDDFPLNISLTGLAWHSILTVCCGWYLFRRALLLKSPVSTMKASAVGGLLWALWSVWWWIDKGLVSTPGEYAVYALITGTILIACLWISAMIPSTIFRPSRGEIITISVIFVLYYFFVTIKASNLAFFVLPVCMGLAFYALSMNKERETTPDVITQLDGKVYPLNYAALLVMPAVSILVYSLLYYAHLRLRTGPVFYMILTPAGFIIFVVSYVKMVRKPKTSADVREPSAVELPK